MVRNTPHSDAEAMLLSLIPAVAPSDATDARFDRLVGVCARALYRLDAEERVYLKMWLLDGCAEREIARAFHFDPRAFRCRFHRFLLSVQRHLAQARVPPP